MGRLPIRKLRMKKRRMRDTTCLATMIGVVLAAAGCSHTDKTIKWSDDATPPSGFSFSNGMPPSSQGPSPAWYAQRYNRARGIGEAVKQNRRSLWDNSTGTFVYDVGGVLYAQYHPWEHYLRIRTDNKDESNTVCQWSEDGKLTITSDNGPVPASAEQTCKQLLDHLAYEVAPSGILSHNAP